MKEEPKVAEGNTSEKKETESSKGWGNWTTKGIFIGASKGLNTGLKVTGNYLSKGLENVGGYMSKKVQKNEQEIKL